MSTQFPLDFTERAYALARRTDPSTSHAAAARVAQFGSDHHIRILAALLQGPATVYELERRTGIPAHAVGKRMAELERVGRALPIPDLTRASPTGRQCRVWDAVANATV